MTRRHWQGPRHCDITPDGWCAEHSTQWTPKFCGRLLIERHPRLAELTGVYVGLALDDAAVMGA